MNVTVLEVDAPGLIGQPYLSLRCGEGKRLRPLRPEESFAFPAEGLDANGTVQLDAFVKVGTQISKFEADRIQDICVQTAGGAPIFAKLKVAFSGVPAPAKKQSQKQRVEKDAEKYLTSHDVWGTIQRMLAVILKKRPEDPLVFMQDYIANLRGEAAVATPVSKQENTEFSAEVCPESMPDFSIHNSLMAKVFKHNPQLYPKLKARTTSLGTSLARCIKPGMDVCIRPGKFLGVVAGDCECYDMFAELFDAVIDRERGDYSKDARHVPDVSADKIKSVPVDTTGLYALSARVEVRRNFWDLRLPGACDSDERREAERVISKAFVQQQDEDMRGEYFPLAESTSFLPRPSGMTRNEQELLERDNILFPKPSSADQVAEGLARDWPDARGVFAAASRKVAVWCNEEDHMRIASQEGAGDIRGAFLRLTRVMGSVEQQFVRDGYEFARSDRLGYLTACPSNLGTALRVSVMLRVPYLSNSAKFSETVSRFQLTARPVLSPNSDGLHEVSLDPRLGVSEVDQINTVIDGCSELVRLERSLEPAPEPALVPPPVPAPPVASQPTPAPAAAEAAADGPAKSAPAPPPAPVPPTLPAKSPTSESAKDGPAKSAPPPPATDGPAKSAPPVQPAESAKATPTVQPDPTPEPVPPVVQEQPPPAEKEQAQVVQEPVPPVVQKLSPPAEKEAAPVVQEPVLPSVQEPVPPVVQEPTVQNPAPAQEPAEADGQPQVAGLKTAALAEADGSLPKPQPSEPESALPSPGTTARSNSVDEDFVPGFPRDICPTPMPDIAKHQSVMAELLLKNPSIYDSLAARKTEMGVSFAQCIKPGMDNPGHPLLKVLGVVAGDMESYTAFKELFDPVIEKRHNGYKPDALHPTDLSVDKVSATQVDPTGKYAISCRVRTSRNVRGFCQPPACDRGARKEIEQLLSKSLQSLKDEDLTGKYYPLRGSKSYLPMPGGMSEEEEAELEHHSFLFYEPDSKVQIAAGLGRNWPEARGAFVGNARQIVIWCNEEDHMHLVSLQRGCDLREAFSRFVRAVEGVEASLTADGYGFAQTSHLGYVTTCPSNLGTALRVSVMLSIPLLAEHRDFKKICRELSLQPRKGTQAGLHDLANSERLGTSEVDLVNKVIEGCAKLVSMEQTLEKDNNLTSFGYH